MYSGLQQKGATQKGALSHSTGGDVPGKGGNGYWLEKQKFDMANFHADILFNFSNLFCGYNEKRIWNCSPYAGLGWARVWKSPSAKEVSANVGILNSFRLCSALDLNLDVRAMLVNDRFDGEMCITDRCNSFSHSRNKMILFPATPDTRRESTNKTNNSGSVSYTHLDVYKRQSLRG